MGAGCSLDSWRLLAERGVSAAVVVVSLRVADHNSGLRKRAEHVDGEAFVAHGAVERLDVAVAPGLAGAGRGRRLHSPERRPAALVPLRFTFHTAFGVATAEPHGATRWRYEHEGGMRFVRKSAQPNAAGRMSLGQRKQDFVYATEIGETS